ncbi:hypothetical protein V8E54_003757 [Elaphomyces granulatus]|jgi:hypothetical protein
MPAYPLPEIDTTFLLSPETYDKAATEVNDVTNDYGTPNLLFLYYIPFPPEAVKDDLYALKEELQSWHAYELEQAERQVHIQINNGNLPTDDSLASRVKRTNYRAKVIQFLRENSEVWVTMTQEDKTGPKTIVVKKEEANGAIRWELLSRYITQGRLPEQFSVILNVINGIIAADPEADNRYWFSHAYLKYDNGSRTFQPDIRSSSFTVTQKDIDEHKDTVSIEFTHADYKWRLDRTLWRKQRQLVEDIIEAGEKIRKEMSFDFFVTS